MAFYKKQNLEYLKPELDKRNKNRILPLIF